MKEIKNCKCVLATELYFSRQKGVTDDGREYDFISTMVRDENGKAHGIAIQPVVWNALCGCSALDTITFMGTLYIPEGVRGTPGSEDFRPADEGYAKATRPNRRTGELHTMGDLMDAKPISVVRSEFPAEKFPRFEDIPVAVKSTANSKPALKV